MLKVPLLAQDILTSLFKALKNIDNIYFKEKIWPKIEILMTGDEIPAQALYILLINCNEIINRIENIIQKRILPLIYKSLECKVDALQDMSLSKIPEILKSIDSSTIRSQVLPKIVTCMEISSINVK